MPLSAVFWEMWIYKARRAEKREVAGGVGGCETAFGGDDSWMDLRSVRRVVVGGDGKAFCRDGYGSEC